MKLKLYGTKGIREVTTELPTNATWNEVLIWVVTNAPDCIAYDFI